MVMETNKDIVIGEEKDGRKEMANRTDGASVDVNG